MTVTGNAGERSAVTTMHQWDHSESIAPICVTVRCVVVVLELMGVAEVNACGMTVAGNAGVRSAVTAKCQERHSKSIAPIRKSVRCVVVMLDLMGVAEVDAYMRVVARNGDERSAVTAMCQTEPPESNAPIRKSVGWMVVVLVVMVCWWSGCLRTAAAGSTRDRSSLTVSHQLDQSESIAPIRMSVRLILVGLLMMEFCRSGGLWTAAAPIARNQSNLTIKHHWDHSESIAPIRRSMRLILVVLVMMEFCRGEGLPTAAARSARDRFNLTAMHQWGHI